MGLEYVPGDSVLHRMDPRTKIIIFLGVVVLSIIIVDPFLIGLMLLITVVMYRVASIPREKLTIVLKPTIPAFFMFVFLNYFVSPPAGARIYFYLIPHYNIAPVTLETSMIGISSGLRFALFIIITRLITLVTPVSDLLVALINLRFPVEAAVSLGIAFASVPLMVNQFRTVIEAQKSRGAKFEIRNPFKKMRAYVPIIVPSIYLTVLRGIDISKTIESRAFTYNPAKRTFRQELAFIKLDYLTVFVTIIGLIPLIYLKIQYGWFGYLHIYKLLQETVFPWIEPYFQQISSFFDQLFISLSS